MTVKKILEELKPLGSDGYKRVIFNLMLIDPDGNPILIDQHVARTGSERQTEKTSSCVHAFP